MCVGQQVRGVQARPALLESDADSQTASRTYRQPMKPRLPRKLTNSARINLNHYWAVLEEMVTCDVITRPPSTTQSFDDVDLANEINENIANQCLEEGEENLTSRFVPLTPREERDVALRLAPVSATCRQRLPSAASVIPEVMHKSRRSFWRNMFRDSPSPKREASKPILKIVKTLSKQLE